ncbi:hypothetical protein [Paludibaculum fermentans]|uniref:RCC1 domain-containing protein n=1 Tax=Paludibaculum fermentans TaxID=1473598 RepID=UPI003EB883D0
MRLISFPLTSFFLIAALVPVTQAAEAAAGKPQGIVRLLATSPADNDARYGVLEAGQIPGAVRIAIPEAGGHVLVLTRAGTVWAWGDNSQGQLGTGDREQVSGWRAVEGLSAVKAIAAGAGHSLALTEDGDVWAWGANFEGQLGDGTLLARMRPQKVPELLNVVSIAAGAKFSAALQSNGNVLVFGANWNGLASNQTDRILVRPVTLPSVRLTGELAVSNGRLVSRDRRATVNTVPWPGEGGLSRVVRWTNDGVAVEEGGSVQQRIDVAEGIVDLAAGWTVGWIEGGGDEGVESQGSSSDGKEYRMGGALATADLAISVTTGVGFTVGSPAGYVVTLTNAGGAATSGNITVTDVLPSGLGFLAGAGTGWSCAAVGQTVTCASAGSIGVAGTSVIYLHVKVGLAAFPSVSNTASVSVTGDGNTANNSSTTVTAVAAQPSIPSTGAIAGGSFHSLRLATDGRVWAAGQNSSGELGDGTYSPRIAPVLVSGLNGIRAVAAGSNFSVALKGDGTVWTWGVNSNGQLGDGTTSGRNVPQAVTGLSGVVAISAQYAQALALKDDGTVWAWGNNNSGQLGDGTTTNRLTPVQVTGLNGVIGIAAGRVHSLALRMDGTMWGWGNNANGRIGDGTTQARLAPVQVSGMTGTIAIAAGYSHSMALKGNGTVWTWGMGMAGELGNGTNSTNQLLPAQLNSLSGVTSIAAFTMGSLALLGDGTVWEWGAPSMSSVPKKVGGVSGATAIGIGGWWTYSFAFAIQNDGATMCWGDNRAGQLGTGAAVSRVLPAAVAGLAGVSALSAREYATLALKGDGTVWSWGNNDFGQLGDGTTVSRATPVQVSGLSGVTAVSSGAYHSLAIRSDGTVWSWGDNEGGMLGDGTTLGRQTPMAIPGLSGVLRVRAGYSQSLAIKNDGTLWAWGANTHGEIGDGTTTTRLSPVPVPGLTGVVAMATGDDFSVALKSDGTVWSWGDNSNGQVGDGTTVQRLSPGLVHGLSGIVAISSGYGHGIALRSDGTVWVWGSTAGNGMGDGTNEVKGVPVQVSGLSGIVAISGGGRHSLALKNDGSVWTWGANSEGQLGDGTRTNRWSPVRVATLANVAGIAGGGAHSLALMPDGTVRAWGSEEYGQVGDNSPVSPATPMQALPFGYADLTVSMSDDGPVPVGGQLVYTVTVTNLGQLASSGVTTVTNILPVGTYFASASGAGWTCQAIGQVVTCTTSAPIGPSVVTSITIRANVSASAVPAVSNVATVTNASDLNFDNNTSGDPLVVGITSALSVTPASGSGAQQIFQAVYSGALGFQQLRWVQLLFGTAPDGGGQPFCFLHYDVQGNGLWLYSDQYGFFRGPVPPGAASLELQGSHCALNAAGSTASGSGSNLTLNLSVAFKAAATRNIYMRAMDTSNFDTGWQQRGTWTQVGAALPTLVVAPNSGGGQNPTFTLTFPDPPGFTGSALGWEEFLVAASTDGGGQPFCFVHYDRAGNGLWMYSSDVGFFLGPVPPGTASGYLNSSACTVVTAGTMAQNVSGNLVMTVTLGLKPTMVGVKNLYLRMMDPLNRDTGWQQKGTWTIP